MDMSLGKFRDDVLVKQEKIDSHIFINGSCEMCGATEGLEYTLVDGGYSVSVGTATKKVNIVIPSYYNPPIQPPGHAITSTAWKPRRLPLRTSSIIILALFKP